MRTDKLPPRQWLEEEAARRGITAGAVLDEILAKPECGWFQITGNNVGIGTDKPGDVSWLFAPLPLDPDLKQMRVLYWLAAAANLLLGFGVVYHGEYFMATAAALWALLCSYMARSSINAHQTTRNNCREVKRMIGALAEHRAWPDD